MEAIGCELYASHVCKMHTQPSGALAPAFLAILQTLFKTL